MHVDLLHLCCLCKLQKCDHNHALNNLCMHTHSLLLCAEKLFRIISIFHRIFFCYGIQLTFLRRKHDISCPPLKESVLLLNFYPVLWCRMFCLFVQKFVFSVCGLRVWIASGLNNAFSWSFLSSLFWDMLQSVSNL